MQHKKKSLQETLDPVHNPPAKDRCDGLDDSPQRHHLDQKSAQLLSKHTKILKIQRPNNLLFSASICNQVLVQWKTIIRQIEKLFQMTKINNTFLVRRHLSQSLQMLDRTFTRQDQLWGSS